MWKPVGAIRQAVVAGLVVSIAYSFVPLAPALAEQPGDAVVQTTSRRSVIVIGGPSAIAESVRTTVASHVGSVDRIAGVDRYDTSAIMSRRHFSAPVGVAYVTVGTNFPDALAGAAAAGAQGGPVLLTHRDRLPDSVSEELRRLRPRTVIVLGGPASVSDAVVAQVAAVIKGSVERVAGSDRFSTAAQVSALAYPDGASLVFVATGERFPDALVGAALAGQRRAPLLLVRQSALPSSTLNELTRLAPSQVIVLGGEGAVSRGVLHQIASATGVLATRIAGADRYRTAALVNAEMIPSDRVLLASGTNFADALVAGAVAAATGSGLLLTDSRTLSVGAADSLGVSTAPPTTGGGTGGGAGGGAGGGDGGAGGAGGGGGGGGFAPPVVPVRFFAFTGDECTVVGTPGDDILIGTPGDDVICGLGGNDSIIATSGDDIIDGGTGNNTISYASFTADLVIDLSSGSVQASGVLLAQADPPSSFGVASAATAGLDLLQSIHNVTAGAGNDVVTGSAQANIIYGGPGDDVLNSGGGDNQLFGGTGNDVLVAGSGNNRLDGGSGVNTIDVAWSSGLNICVHDPLNPAELCLPSPTVTSVGTAITVTLPELPSGWTPSMRLVFEIYDLGGTRVGASSPGSVYTPGASHSIAHRDGALAPDTEFRVMSRIWDGMIGYPRYRTASEATIVRTPPVDALPVLPEPQITGITSSTVTVAQPSAPDGWTQEAMARSFSAAVYQVPSMARIGTSSPGSRYTAGDPLVVSARSGALLPGTAYCVAFGLYESVHRRSTESDCVAFTTATVDPLPHVPAPVVLSVAPLEITVARPSQPAGWTTGWSLVARVFDPATGRTVGQVGLGDDFTPETPLIVRAGIRPLHQDTDYCVTFMLFEALHRRTTETACVAFRTSAAPPLPVLGAPTILAVSSWQVTVEQPPRPEGWLTDWRFTAHVYDATGRRVGAVAPDGGYAPGAPMSLSASNRALESDTNYCIAFNLYDDRYRHSTLSDCVPFRTGIPDPLPVFGSPVVVGASMSHVTVVQPPRPEGWVDHWFGRWIFSASIFDPNTMVWLGGVSLSNSYTPGQTFTLQAGTSLLQPDTEYCVAFTLYEGLHRRSTTSDCVSFRTATATPLPTPDAPVISTVTWRDVTVTHPATPSGWTAGMRFSIRVVRADSFVDVGAVTVTLTPGASATVTSNDRFLSGDETYCVRFRVTDAVYSNRFTEGPCTTFITPPAEFAPTITSTNPSSGTALGGTEVTITGTDLSIVDDVRFGTARASIVFRSEHHLTVRTPDGTDGAVDVTVRSHGGRGVLAEGFTYLTPGRITGTVTVAGGQGVPNVTVIARSTTTGPTVVVRSAHDGAYALDRLPDGNYTVQFVPDHGSNLLGVYHLQTTVSAQATPVTATAGVVTAGINAVLPVAASLSGVVADASNTPVVGAMVRVFMNQSFVASTSTSASGEWQIRGLGGGAYIIEVRPPEGSGLFARFHPDSSSSAMATPVSVAVGVAVSDLLTVLPAGGVITGVVRNGAGHPVAGVTVAALPLAGDGPVPVSVTDHAGVYTLSGLFPGPHTVWFNAPPGSGLVDVYFGNSSLPENATSIAVVAGQTTSGVDVTLPAGGSISGVVTTVAGYALQGVTVSAILAHVTVSAVTEADGSYVLSGLSEGQYLIRFTSDASLGMRTQYYRAAETAQDALLVEVRVSEVTDLVDAVLQQLADIIVVT